MCEDVGGSISEHAGVWLPLREDVGRLISEHARTWLPLRADVGVFISEHAGVWLPFTYAVQGNQKILPGNLQVINATI